jgi:uncharacterized protein DUF6496
MPEKETIERARRDARQGKSPSTQAGEFVREEIHHVREGKHGARSTKQAVAIGLSKARRSGVKLPPRGRRGGSSASTSTRRRRSGRTSPRRSRAVRQALRREGRSAASRKSLAAQARSAARRRSAADRRAAARKAARTKGPTRRRQAARKAARTRRRKAS